MSGGPIFGTDGVRDRAGEGFLARDSVKRIVAATAAVLRRRERFPEDFPSDRGERVLVARDTRESGKDLFDLVSAEFRARGFPVGDLGILPTPGASFTARSSSDSLLGVVLSASHNPAEYNGIKFISPTGAKISPAFEEAVSDAYHRGDGVETSPTAHAAPPVADLAADARDRYVDFLVGRAWRPGRFRGRSVALDTANGAAFEVAPRVFEALGLTAQSIGDTPDGRNINLHCGALHPEALSRTLREGKGSLGFCFDGDADRMIPVTGSGRILDGDFVLALAGRAYHRQGKLPKKVVVGTVMANIGLEKSLAEEGIELLRTPVGDRHVHRCLVEEGHPIGGEQSGHLIFLEDLPTGDGILAAVRLLDVLETEELDLDEECRIMTRYPQVLKNVRVREKRPLEGVPAVATVVREVESALGGEGRVLVRYSGTEPLARVMLEGPNEELIGSLCDRVCAVIEESLGAA